MASMQFRYDGLRRPEPKQMCFFGPRYRRDYAPPSFDEAPRKEGKEITAQQGQQEEQQQARPVEQHLPQAEQQILPAEQQAEQAKQAEQAGEAEDPKQVQQAEEGEQQAQQAEHQAEQAKHKAGQQAQQAEQLFPQEAFAPKQAQFSKFKTTHQQGEQAKQKQSTVMVSEILLANLVQTEGQIERVKEQVDLARIVLDEFLFKIDSILQILGIVRANETKSASLTTAAAVSYKSSKDAIDELLELFQGPVFQKILRQVLIQVFVPESGGTNFARQS